MILIDFNQIIISLSIRELNNTLREEPDDIVEYSAVMNLFLEYVLSVKKKYSKKYGNIVICCDNKHFWRKDVFPYYKHSRKKDRETSKFDWNFVFDGMSSIKRDLIDYFPYRVLEVDKTEADDIIAILTKEYYHLEKILILSSDKDFKQLQIYDGVFQYSQSAGKFLVTENPLKFLREHIIRGDRSDGIPNILSDDDVFATGKRQISLRKKSIIDMMDISKNPSEFCNEDMIRRYDRNKQLIDFSCIPDEIVNNILDLFVKSPNGNNRTMMEYFQSRRMMMFFMQLDNFKEDINETYTRSIF
jgi:hypothetical protein